MVKTMKLKDKLLYRLSKNQLARNKQFKNLHKGECCYIFGNGASIKSMNLAKFNDRIAIGCNSLFLHYDFEQLNCRYYQIPPSFLFYRFRKFYGKLQRNYLGDLYRNKIQAHPRTNFFTNISNMLNMQGANIFYEHHFGYKKSDPEQCALDDIFSYTESATTAMLGMAIYMGFEQAILVGIDYTFSPRWGSHFFEKGRGVASPNNDEIYYKSFFEECQNHIDLTVLTLDGIRSNMKYQSYSEYVCEPSNYKENTEIVAKESLVYLHKQGFYSIY